MLKSITSVSKLKQTCFPWWIQIKLCHNENFSFLPYFSPLVDSSKYIVGCLEFLVLLCRSSHTTLAKEQQRSTLTIRNRITDKSREGKVFPHLCPDTVFCPQSIIVSIIVNIPWPSNRKIFQMCAVVVILISSICQRGDVTDIIL